jgi:stearoyl-CoA desaturase (delta-9 desaturase)
MKLTHNNVMKTFQIGVHVISVPGIAWAIYQGWWSWLLASVLIYWFIIVVGVSVGFHRFLSHRSFELSRPIEIVLMFIGVLGTIGSPALFASIHRIHHANADTKFDPHSPHQIGIAKAWMGMWSHKGVAKSLRPLQRLLRDDWLYRVTHNYYGRILSAWIVLLALIDPWAVVYLYAIPSALVFNGLAGLTVVTHLHGYRSHDLDGDTSLNSWIANLMTLGEGWHNNHHANPRKWNLRERWWEWDLGAQVVRLIRKSPSETT